MDLLVFIFIIIGASIVIASGIWVATVLVAVTFRRRADGLLSDRSNPSD